MFLCCFNQLAVQGSSPGVRAGHAVVNIGTKASDSVIICKLEQQRSYSAVQMLVSPSVTMIKLSCF